VVNANSVAIFICSIKFSCKVAGVIHLHEDMVALLIQILIRMDFNANKGKVVPVLN
jgi:hypothetical protein